MSKPDKIAAAAVPPLLHSYAEARAMLGGVPASTFDLWIAQGLVVPVHIGRRRAFIRHEDLVRLAQGAEPAACQPIQKAVL